jgi:hypothetical protein
MPHFEWDDKKDKENKSKHAVSFRLAQYAFSDPKRIIAKDLPTAWQKSDFFVSAA